MPIKHGTRCYNSMVFCIRDLYHICNETELIRLKEVKLNQIIVRAFLVFLFFIVFSYGVLVGKYEYFPFKILAHVKHWISNTKHVLNLSVMGLEACDIPIIDYIPQEATVIVGHAYGSPGEHGDYIASEIYAILNSHRDAIKRLIFTGDVFFVSKSDAWSRLDEDFRDSFEIHVAPGNHDVGVGLSASRDVFNDSPFAIKDSRVIDSDEARLVIEDSVKQGWEISEKTKSLLSYSDGGKPVFLFRHNISIEELVPVANSRAGKSDKLPTAADLTSSLAHIDQLTIISGDSGAFKFLPRFTCHKFKNTTFITNGIGEVIGDSVLVLVDGEVYRHILEI